MRKIVNGKIIDIKNMELFELAAEGLARQNATTSVTAEGVVADLQSPLVRRYIKQYDVLKKALPYPLYAIETDIKYAMMGSCIKRFSREPLKMWVKDGLHIQLDSTSGMTLKLVNNTWSIEYVTDSVGDNTSTELYKDQPGYNEFTWVLRKILNKEGTVTFYKEFMPEFVVACNNQPVILKWELENMLTFGSIPDKMHFPANKIIDIDENKEYTLDIFADGEAEIDDETQTVWNFTGPGISTYQKKKSIKIYKFDAYSKGLDKVDKISKCTIPGLNNLFMQLCGIRTACEYTSFPDFVGAISNEQFAFVIENRLYVTKKSRINNPVMIATDVELYTLEHGRIYFTRSKHIDSKIKKDILYAYNFRDNTMRACKVVYRD